MLLGMLRVSGRAPLKVASELVGKAWPLSSFQFWFC